MAVSVIPWRNSADRRDRGSRRTYGRKLIESGRPDSGAASCGRGVPPRHSVHALSQGDSVPINRRDFLGAGAAAAAGLALPKLADARESLPLITVRDRSALAPTPA